MRLVFVAAISVAVALAACSSSDPAAPGSSPMPDPNAADAAVPAPAGALTFHKDVEPLLQKICQNCHIAGGIAPFALVTYEQTKAVAADIVFQTKAHTMPPWGAQDTAECKPPKPWLHDLRLTEAEIATIDKWHTDGDYEGDPKDAPPPRAAAPSTGLTGALSVAPAAPFSLSGTADTFRCFVLDPNITSIKYLNATNFVPKNKTIVHHALMFSIPAGTAVPADQYECFGGTNIAGANLVAAWAPGGVPNEYPADVALPLAAGTKFVMQIHYHPHANATPDPDTTTFQYRVTDTPPTYQAKVSLIGNFKGAVDAATGIGLEPGADDPGGTPTFVIPANAPAHIETMRFQMPAALAAATPNIWILGVGAHMHLAGHDEKISLTRGTQSSCLLQEPAWNFNWQRGYQYDSPIEQLPTIQKDDVLEMRCTYNNSMTNVSLMNALRESGASQPKDISLGEATTDEMCLGAVTFVFKAK